MTEQEKFRQYLILAKKVLSATKYITRNFNALYSSRAEKLSFQERVFVGLNRKMYLSFKSLVEDAKKGRAEAMHHLKTLTESSIYFFWAAKEDDDTRSKFVLALSYKNKEKFFNANKENYPDCDSCLLEWRKALNDLIKNKEKEWEVFSGKTIGKIADEDNKNLKSLYNRIYRLACEPAHISDLIDYLPSAKDYISLDPPKISMLWVNIAMDYGIFIAYTLLESCSTGKLFEYCSAKGKRIFYKKIDEIKTEYNKIRSI